jgi:hypothetical protein
MSGVLWGLIALAATLLLVVLLLSFGLARSAAQSDQVEHKAQRRWIASKRRGRRAA